MDQEDSFEVKTTASIEPPKTPNPNVPDSIPSIDSDSSLSEEETITKSDNRGSISLSPLCTQYNDNDSISDCVLVSDEEIMESIYQNLLRIVFSLQIQHVAAASASAEIWCFDDDGCKTPPPSSRSLDSDMVPDTCPGAPMKLTKITRKIDSGLRRKLF
ncbi:Cyclin-dependent protein kinase inhibitor SMR11 [Cardamine amara subsp. amara]|uniref:Cyclin-dependent protein kinase inhibitor SMR11 n=1 Tax=Cardamine amara subsp. amara TaxID=228776 RepID=A0ABD1A3J5_CARAN